MESQNTSSWKGPVRITKLNSQYVVKLKDPKGDPSSEKPGEDLTIFRIAPPGSSARCSIH